MELTPIDQAVLSIIAESQKPYAQESQEIIAKRMEIAGARLSESDTGQCRANFFSAQVELAGAFSAVSSTDDKDLAVIMGRLAVILRNVSLDVA
ncbi:hypothetical protein Atc_m058 (plasmid) [Acidithiobacillus caldus SM-1]|uniref:Uncharacterized protein n=1 Tax=Acidithiobacillus caldus (strain SM-1) TaxID=990288 RepID=F9ZUM3_ACICS|nr:hypothetical protein [Acidithiobacillus caldus]AEK59589.1 hypothetical protein Atc_m058 [Acidithiobacillus caldus SM-1]MDA8181498.1 hypothetical protein [Acidithiobacillus sp.]QER44899.1 hypothetical protein F0726_01835 [Acidithiobacillus caldus]